MIRVEDWSPIDGLILEPNAMMAATTLGQNVVVAAGPGAGKTELLAQRADFLLQTGSCPYPRRILAVSFKIDAARNLRERVRLRSGGQFAARFDSFTFHAFAKRIIDNYRPALTGQNALNANYRVDPDNRIAGEQITFKDLVPLALEILGKNRYVRGGIRQTYSHVFLDEFQDATDEQYALVKEAFTGSGATLTAVGDVKQRIMAWAGALDGILQTFSDDFAAAPMPLYQNFRSAPRLRRMQNRMIAQMDPVAASDANSIVGEDGIVDVLAFDTDVEEAERIADKIQEWLNNGVEPAEIAILVRQQPHLVAATLSEVLTERGIPFRNEQTSQDLNAEPAATLVFNFLRVIADERQAAAYTELMRVAARSDASEEESLRFDRQLKRLIQDARKSFRDFNGQETGLTFWRDWVKKLNDLVSRPVLIALSPGYQQGSRLEDVIDKALNAFEETLRLDGDATAAVRRLSESDAIRILTIHKSKGLEFEHVIVLGVERDLFWGNPQDSISEFFVAISRAKNHLVLTRAGYRECPIGHTGRWERYRTAHLEFLGFATEG
ncbi:UvrD-helicase domain-containing protein [Glutamicibacter sp. 287]|uniref:UvrD-helicase domain-containing protein n=1 Tax=unclassified Glutamicibacter TaxID=2627139 RepID=UPI0040340E95